MAAIFQADIYCDGCAIRIKDEICGELWDHRDIMKCPDGTPVTDFDNHADLFDYLESMDEETYDSNEYPKYCSDDEESDSPQHCGAHKDCINYDTINDCSCFLENSLTSYGIEYVKEIILSDLRCYPNSVSITVWLPYYRYVLDINVDECTKCGKLAELHGNDECEDCMDDSIKSALRFFGIDADPSDCDICEDGSVYYGLTQIIG